MSQRKEIKGDDRYEKLNKKILGDKQKQVKGKGRRAKIKKTKEEKKNINFKTNRWA